MEFGFGISPSFTVPSVQNPYLYGLPSTDTLRIDDLLDFSSNDALLSNSTVSDSHILGSQPSGNVKVEPDYSYHSHSHSNVSSFADDIYIPTEEEAELEWLSKFVEDSFTDVPYPSNYLQPATIGHVKQEYGTQNLTADQRGARTKRIKLVNHTSSSSSASSSSSSDFTGQMVCNRRRTGEEGGEGGARRCTHCASDRTPQWRTGPHGPKTLCNACGVRFKSGRLVPEYRPAASPTFVLTQHSNSHRKVMELRRQKEQLRGIIRHDG